MTTSGRFTELPPTAGPMPQRRWFTSDDMDLIVWLDGDSALHAFQLCYGKPQQEKALTWSATSGFTHLGVDDGSVADLGYKRSPLLQADSAIDVAALLRQLAQARAGLPDAIFSAVRQCLQNYPGARHDQ